jgi:hypothetical protein
MAQWLRTMRARWASPWGEANKRHQYLKRAVDDPNDEYYLASSTPNRSGAVTRLLEDPDEYRAQSIF